MPGTLSFVTLDVFTTVPFAGNPLAVVLVPSYLSATLPQETKQRIAREFNLSETTFLHLPAPSSHRAGGPGGGAEVPEWRLDIFLTTAEVPLAGHPVIGSAVRALRSAGAGKGWFVTKAGRVEVGIDEAGVVTAVIPHEVHLHEGFAFGAEEVGAQQPGLRKVLGQRLGGLEVQTLSIVRGMTFVFVRLPDLVALGEVGLFSQKLDAKALDDGWNQGVLMMMFYVVESEEDGVVNLRTRMIEGMFEDPATGSASCGLACLLSLRKGLQEDGLRRFEMTQGVELGRRSDIAVDCEIKDGSIKSVALKGTAVEIMKGEVRYE